MTLKLLMNPLNSGMAFMKGSDGHWKTTSETDTRRAMCVYVCRELREYYDQV